jgi:hypothetical protein
MFYGPGREPRTLPMATHTELWPIDKIVPYSQNSRKNNAAVSRMCASIREFGKGGRRGGPPAASLLVSNPDLSVEKIE